VASLKEAVELIGREAFKHPARDTGGSPVTSPAEPAPASPARGTGGSPMIPPQPLSRTPRPPSNRRKYPSPAHIRPDRDRNRHRRKRSRTSRTPRRRASAGAAAAEADANAPELGRGSNVKIQQLLLQILLELKRQRAERGEFSIPKFLAAAAQVISLALLILGVFSRNSPAFKPPCSTPSRFRS